MAGQTIIQGEEFNLSSHLPTSQTFLLAKILKILIIFLTFKYISGFIQPGLFYYHHIGYSLILTKIF